MWRKIIIIFSIIAFPNFAYAQCLKVADDPELQISAEALEKLKPINYGREQVFDALYRTSLYETGGCWATPVGNFDAQTLSVGVLQWNYGQNSLQDLMIRYRNKFETEEAFNQEITKIMPQFGTITFAPDCMTIPTLQSCKDKILAAHDEKGKLKPEIFNEYEALFNSKIMRQVQTEKFIDFLGELSPKITEIFPNPTDLHVKWGIDVAIQQGFVKHSDNKTSYLNPQDVANIRKLYAPLDEDTKRNRSLSIIRWYSGLCGGIYQGVNIEQCNYNIKNWCSVIYHGLSDDQFDLLNLTYVRSRIAQGQSGRWQANAFARRVKIVLNTGQVGKEVLELPKGIRKSKKCNKWLVEEE